MVMVMSMHSQPCRDYSADTNELVCWMKGHILTFPKTWCTSGFHDIWVKQHRPGNRNITYSLWSLCFFSFTFICSLAQSSRIAVQPLEHIPFFIHMNLIIIAIINPKLKWFRTQPLQAKGEVVLGDSLNCQLWRDSICICSNDIPLSIPSWNWINCGIWQIKCWGK
jgi:hypothetical protein